ncbi:beta-ketoacyl-ACP synthase II [Desulfurivibrio alkaliphilus]|uniref:3-oxoacyl-[acyl-carrier-protein] synthase 2 n=1 Tax=Desulfurivibrio alkaliphilus (strain DSM 19089 / UNIQEM U267 / AHT2) TaxID=589865 RepID=D6Z354_DESAT|nr:beta-ketoacyl-ACP synthase II [Desulfurivibrio alkaliphilus]ADH85979.1 3-oxoacyl-(acyl-carrier-protein) synthase 2 [Desulfurivibrio alkaliphilus AHT 2]
MVKRRVVVTGIGLVSPVGTGVDRSWEALCAGRGGIGPITRYDASGQAVRIAAEVKDFNSDDHFEPKQARHLELFVQYAVVAAREALADSGFQITPENAARVGSIIGCGMGGLPVIEKYVQVLHTKGERRITPFFIPMAIPNMGAGQVSIFLGTKGPNLSLTTACAAGTHAVGEAFRAISNGDCDLAFTGGSEGVICPMAFGGFHAMKALSTRNDAPEKASRPFDKDRDGFIIGEGGGIMLLEELEHAKARGAKIYAEMAGYGMSGDAYHIAAPPEDGAGAVLCMENALKDAGMSPGDIDYINAHGTSTPLNDEIETRAIKKVFGEHAARLAVSSTKSMTGHLLGGAGGIEAVITALAVKHQLAPPTINLEEPGPDCDLDYVPGQARAMAIRAAMSNSFGFGGTNAVMIMKSYEP